MAGGLINIVSYGSSDLYLTGSPQITFFKMVYRRHTNFSVESIYVDVEDELTFGSESEVIVPPVGDAIHKGYLEILLPEFAIKRSDIGITTTTSTSDLDQKLENYNKVIEFMELNTKAYRTAYANIYAENITTLTVVESALEQFSDDTFVDGSSGLTSKSSIIEDYNTLLATTSGLTIGSSNLYSILDSIRNDIVNGATVEKDTLLERLDRAIANSIKVQGYFFELTLADKDVVADSISENVKFAWVKRLGHVIIDYIDVFIGGEKIDRHYGLWMDIWYELTGNRDQSDIYAKMIGDVDELTTFDRNTKPSYRLQIPLNFWFNRHNGLSFPLVALQYSDLVFNIKLKDISKCCYMERLVDSGNNELFISLEDVWDDGGYILDSRMMLDYVYMERNERKKFAQSSHEYLIDVTQHMRFKNITNGRTQIQLDFRHPCKELIWVAQKDEIIRNTTSFTQTHNDVYAKSADKEINPFNTSYLSFNGYSRVDKFGGNYFNYYQAMRHRNTPADGINLYSFGLFPEEHQPSGTCNLSKIPGVKMRFTFDDDFFTYKLSEVRPDITPGSEEDLTMTTAVTIHVFAISYNILRIIGGFGGLAYS